MTFRNLTAKVQNYYELCMMHGEYFVSLHTKEVINDEEIPVIHANVVANSL